MDIKTFLNDSEYKFEDTLSVGNYCYVDLGDFQILGLDREIVGNLQLSVIVEEGKIDWIYMCFSEYQYAP